MGADAYGLDRWKASSALGTINVSRIDSNGSPETNLDSRYYMGISTSTTAAKFAFVQILENVDTVPLQGRQVTFQIKLKASTNRNIRIGIMQNEAAATPDVIVNPIMVTANGDTTDPTWGSNLSLIPIDSTTNCTSVSNAATCNVTTSWQNFAVTCTVPTDCENIMVIFFTDAAWSTTEFLYAAEAGLYNTNVVQSYWAPRTPGDETTLCERYYQKSYDVNTYPGDAAASAAGAFGYRTRDSVAASTAGTINQSVSFRTRMRTTPTIVLYSNSGASNAIRDGTGAADRSGATSVGGTNSVSETGYHNISLDNTSTTVISPDDILRWHWTAEAEL